MTYKISMRLAALYSLAADNMSPERVYQEMKAIYKLRSKIVHGSDFDIGITLERDGQKIRVLDAAVEHLRKCLRVLIEHAQYLDPSRIDFDLLLG